MRTLLGGAAALAILVGAAGGSALAAPEIAGDAVIEATAVDHANIVRITGALDAAVDAKDWAGARALFTDTITVDFTSLAGGEPATIPADGLIQGWSSNLTAEKTSFHLRGNYRVTFEGPDRAVVHSHGYAWNRMERGALTENGGDPLWEVWGTYLHTLERTAEGWRIAGMTFTATAQRGNNFVRDTPGQ
ncbi:MAG: nuclear transport factor 2 family protein [Alphaproteobacteria bacterium]|nr:nuclear transport factor 2 family protein [Alphaproteobacteria bacterium]